jgi:hypothetical protein
MGECWWWVMMSGGGVIGGGGGGMRGGGVGGGLAAGAPARMTFCRKRMTSVMLPSAVKTCACSSMAALKAARSPSRTACTSLR